MPSPVIDQIRQQFFAAMGINEYTPISEADAAGLIDQWEQYLFSVAQQSASYGSPYTPNYVPPGSRSYPPPTYVQPPRPGTVVGPRIIAAPPPRTNTGIVPPRIAPAAPPIAPGTPTTYQPAPPPRV